MRLSERAKFNSKCNTSRWPDLLLILFRLSRLKYTLKSVLTESPATTWLFWRTGGVQNHNNSNKIRLMALLMLLTFLYISPESWWSVKGNGCRSLWAKEFDESGTKSFSSEGSLCPFIYSSSLKSEKSLLESQMWATGQFTGKQCIIILWKNNLVVPNKTINK